MLLLMDFWTPSLAWNLMSGLPIRVVLILPDFVLAGTPHDDDDDVDDDIDDDND